MITGKNGRESFAKTSVINFKEQSYKNKYLIIVNHGKPVLNRNNKDNIFEINVEKTKLGTMRNIALELVPPDAIWTTWDDDDWRSKNYLSILFHQLNKDTSKKCLMYKNRLDHNLNTNFTYQVHIASGTYIFFCYKDPYLRYDDLDTKEDAKTKQQILEKGSETIIYDNDPSLYIRFVHNNNTSVYVSALKTQIRSHELNTHIYLESDANIRNISYVNFIKKKYYDNVK